MRRMWKEITVAISLVCGTSLPTLAAVEQPDQTSTGTLQFKAPAEWSVEKTTSSMRVAQYKLARESSDAEDASLVLYYFGQGQGGSTSANIERWVSQIKQTDGSDSRAKAKEESLIINSLKVTTIDVAGT